MATTSNPDPAAAAPSPGYTPHVESPIESHDSWRLDPEALVKDKEKYPILAALLSWKTPLVGLLIIFLATVLWREIDKRWLVTKKATWYTKRVPAKPSASPAAQKPTESPKVAATPPPSSPSAPSASVPSPTEVPSTAPASPEASAAETPIETAPPETLPPPGKITGRATARLLPNRRSRGIAPTSYERFEFTLDAGVLWKLEEKATETPESRAREFTVLEWADGTAHGTWTWHISEDGTKTIGGRFVNLRLVRPNLYRGDLFEEKAGRVVNEATLEIEIKP
ncbi:MAG: hypothetical protein V4674_03965 [Patescibacteria group bacterium]